MANNKVYGNYLMHGRTKGSRNGISTTKGYRAVGQRAKGRIVNGRYVYDNPYLSSYGKLQKAGVNEAVQSIDKGIKNNWQQQAIKNAAKGSLSNKVLNGETKAAKANNGAVYTAKELGYQGTATKSNTPGINTATDPRFNPIGSSKIDHAKGVAWDKKHLRELQAAVAKERAKEIHDSNIAGQNMAYENSKKAANRKAAEKSKAQGAQNNWQQAGNLTRSMTEVARDLRNRNDLEQKTKQQLSDASKYAHQAHVADSYIKNQAHKNAQNQAYHRDLKQQGEKNNWQQQGADAQRKAEAKARWKAGNKAQAAKKSAEQGAKNNWQQQASKVAARENLSSKVLKGETKAAKANNGTVYTAKELGFTSKNAAQKKSAEQGAQNNWQQKAAREAASVDTKNKALNGNSKAVYMPRKVGGDAYVNPSNFEIDTERKPNKTPGANAMRNDPRYDLYGSIKIKEAAVTRAKKSLERNKKPVTSSKSNVSKIEKAITDALKKKKKKK